MTTSSQEHQQEEAVQSCLDILQSTNPADSEKNFQGLQSFLSSSEEKQAFKQQVHTLPFQVQQDPNAKNRPVSFLREGLQRFVVVLNSTCVSYMFLLDNAYACCIHFMFLSFLCSTKHCSLFYRITIVSA